AGVLARGPETREDRVGVPRIEGEKEENVRSLGLAVLSAKGGLVSGRSHERSPLRALVGLQIEQVQEVHVDEARDVLGALEVPVHPVDAVGHAAQHAPSSSTQVSLLPPPCDEFTTSEPSLSATRVRPPGSTKTSLPPLRMYGRRSTCRPLSSPS